MNEGRAQCAFILHFFLSTIFCCPRFFAPLVYSISATFMCLGGRELVGSSWDDTLFHRVDYSEME